MTSPEFAATTMMDVPRHLFMVGTGPAHRQVLDWLAHTPNENLQVTLVQPHNTQWHPALLASFVAGQASAADCQMNLDALVQRSGVQWLRSGVKLLDASRRMLVLDDGSEHTFDWMSIDVEGVQNREMLEQALPGSRKHALFASPLSAFVHLWPQVCVMAQKRSMRFTIVGAGATGTEMALAMQSRFPQHSITLLTGASPACSDYTLAVQSRVLQMLRKRNITVLQDTALEISEETVQLACGAALASDVTLLTTSVQAPRWAQTSGLAQCAQGLLAVDEHYRSTSHPWVFAVGDISSRHPAAPRPRGTAAASQAGLDLPQRLEATLRDQPLPAPRSAAHTRRWSLLDFGQGHALANRGGWTFQGRWVGKIKAWLDRKHVESVNSGHSASR